MIFRKSDGALVGGLTLANIRRGVAQAGSLGYWMGLPHVRQGYMTEAVRAVIPFALETLRLHRLEAACIPTNAGSIRLLENTGFRARGLCPRVFVHQRHVAGSFVICASEGRTGVLTITRARSALPVTDGKVGRLGIATVRLV